MEKKTKKMYEGEVLRRFLYDNEITKEELASRLRVTPTTISHYYQQKRFKKDTRDSIDKEYPTLKTYERAYSEPFMVEEGTIIYLTNTSNGNGDINNHVGISETSADVIAALKQTIAALEREVKTQADMIEILKNK